MARSMLSHGMFSALAASMAVRRRGFPAGSPPPCRAAIVISRITLVKAAPRLASATAFFLLICFHLLWPAIRIPTYNVHRSGSSMSSIRIQRSEEHTSELQSQSNLVCRLLLETKKQEELNTILYIDTPRCKQDMKHREHDLDAVT